MDQEVAILPTQDLTIIPTDIRLSVFTTPGAIEPWLDHVRKSVADFKPDTSTARGRQNIKSIAFEVTKSKTYLTKVGKELADEQKAIPKLIDATRKHITETLEALAVEVRKPLTDWEIADEERVVKHRSAIATYVSYSQPAPETPLATLRSDLAGLEAVPLDEAACEEFLSEYQRARDASVLILKTLIPVREKAEADAAELIQLRAEKAARDERDAFEADMLERQAAEKARAEEAAARKVEDDRKAEEAAAQLVRDTEARVLREAEAKRLADEAEAARRQAADDEAAAALARNIDHRRVINNEVLIDLAAGGIPDDVARKVIGLIASGAVRNATISY